MSCAARAETPVSMVAPAGERHCWAFISHFWRCAKCLRVRRTDAMPPADGCSGGNGFDIGAMQRNGHNVISLACSDGATLYGCHRCRSYTSHGVGYRLTELGCLGRRTRERNRAWRSICQGIHPRLEGVTVEDLDLSRWGDADSRYPLLSLELPTPPSTT